MFGRILASRLLMAIAAVVGIGFAATLTTNIVALGALKVGGPLYQRIEHGKDLIADILPPPEYVIEAYLEATLALDDPTSLRTHSERLKQLHKDYDDRLNYWQAQDIPENIKGLITQKSDEHARAFWRELEGKLLPALANGDSAAAQQSYALLSAAYAEHRKVVDEIVAATNDVNTQLESEAKSLLGFYITATWCASIALFLLTIGGLWAIGRGVVGPLGTMTRAMRSLADGDYSTVVPGTDRSDEIGLMAATVQIFKSNGIDAEQRRKAQESERAQNEETRKAGLRAMADMVESEAGRAVGDVAKSTAEMNRKAESMANSAIRVGTSAQGVSAASSQALASANAIASATEQMTASIREIAARVADAANATRHTVAASAQTKATIAALSAVIGKIGEVADVISAIAGQTNLLAPNATIEAARAGDAGKGFAVVANEVKQLSSQTSRSTEDIRRQIDEIQSVTLKAVEATDEIDKRIGEVDAIATTIAAAIEQQSAATQEIARNVSQTASAMNDVATSISAVSSESKAAGEQSADVRAGASHVADNVEALRAAINRIVRTSSPEVDRRELQRFQIQTSGYLRGRVSGSVQIQSLSESGVQLSTTMELREGETCALEIEGISVAVRVLSARSGSVSAKFEIPASREVQQLLSRHVPTLGAKLAAN